MDKLFDTVLAQAERDLRNGVNPVERLKQALDMYDNEDYMFAMILEDRMNRLALALDIAELDNDGTSLANNFRELGKMYEAIYNSLFVIHMFYKYIIETEEAENDFEADLTQGFNIEDYQA